MATDTVTGNTVLFSAAIPDRETTPEEVVLFANTPDCEFRVIALVTAAARIDDASFAGDRERAALERLKRQAARAGADGVIHIQREIVSGGVLRSSAEWTGLDQAEAESEISRETSEGNSRQIRFRGEAIRINMDADAPTCEE